MLVSRADVETEYLQEFPSEERFLKLPVDGYLELLGLEANAPQRAIINALNNPKYRFVCAAISRRTGKTYIANIIGHLVTLVPNCNVLVISPDYSLSQISFDLQRQLIKHFDIEVARDNSKDKIIELENGSTVRMGSINRVDSVIGRSYNFIIFDECAISSAGEESFNVQLRPTMDVIDAHGNEQSKALFISTPRGRNNWFSKFYDRGFTDEYPAWCSVHATYMDNPRASEDDIREAKNSMPKNEFRQEYLADFCVFEGQIWPFDTEECVRDLSELDTRNMEMLMGIDVGARDPTAVVVVAYDWDEDIYYVLKDYLDSDATTSQHAAYVKSIEDQYGIDNIFIDSANQQTRIDFALDYDINCANAKKSVLDGIRHVEGLIEHNKLIVDTNCKYVLETMDQYQWDSNPNLLKERPMHNNYCHIADALRYVLYSFQVATITF